MNVVDRTSGHERAAEPAVAPLRSGAPLISARDLTKLYHLGGEDLAALDHGDMAHRKALQPQE